MGVAIMADTGSDTLTLNEVAEMMHVSRATIYKLMAEGRLSPVASNNPMLTKQRRVFRRADVERLLREGRKPAADA